MDSKKYLDKVIMSLVKGTKINYETEIVTFPFSITPQFVTSSFVFFDFFPSVPTYSFIIYCKNTFGLTDDEIEYVFKQYREIIFNKIEDGQ